MPDTGNEKKPCSRESESSESETVEQTSCEEISSEQVLHATVPEEHIQTNVFPEDPLQLMLTRVLHAHEAYFDVSRDHEFGGRVFPGYAEFHSSASQYVLIKRAKLWEVSAHEYMFFVLSDHVDGAEFSDLVSFMTTKALDKIILDPEHMTSYLSLVIIARSADSAVEKTIKKTRFRKNFKLGFSGWADLRVALVNLSTAEIITNGMGKALRPTLEANLF